MLVFHVFIGFGFVPKGSAYINAMLAARYPRFEGACRVSRVASVRAPRFMFFLSYFDIIMTLVLRMRVAWGVSHVMSSIKIIYFCAIIHDVFN